MFTDVKEHATRTLSMQVSIRRQTQRTGAIRAFVLRQLSGYHDWPSYSPSVAAYAAEARVVIVVLVAVSIVASLAHTLVLLKAVPTECGSFYIGSRSTTREEFLARQGHSTNYTGARSYIPISRVKQR